MILTLVLHRNYLLSGSGVDAEKLSRNLHAIDLKSTFEPIQTITDTDIDAYLKHEHNLIILTAIEEAKKEVVN
jgi:nuclear pore complex protein Nup93